MADFPRGVLPQFTSELWNPGALKSRALTGGFQIRTTTAVGWSWEEEFPLMSAVKVNDLEVMAFLRNAWHSGEIFDIKHLLTPGSGRPRNGLGTVAVNVLIDGASQVGTSILTDGWGATVTNSVRAGDFIRIGGSNLAHEIVSAADSDAGGHVTLVLNPPVRTAPADNAVVTIDDINFRVTLVTKSQHPRSSSPVYYSGVSMVVAEAVV